MNQVEMLTRFVQECEMDVLLCAGRYTILDQSAIDELLPLCVEKGVSIVIGGIMNSGILADPSPGARFNYADAPAHWLERAQAIRDTCSRHGVNLRHAAIQFPFAHAAVVAVAAGVRSAAHLDDYPTALRASIPADLWADLRSQGLIAEAAPVPA
jgi:D-threo-aldose 1-dehydrogenase